MGIGEGTGVIGQEGMMYESPGEILQGVSNSQPYSGQGYQEPTYSSQTPVQSLQAKPFEQPVYSESTAQPTYSTPTNSQTMPVYQAPVYQTPTSPPPAINNVPPVTNAVPPVQRAPSKPRTIKAAGRSALFPFDEKSSSLERIPRRKRSEDCGDGPISRASRKVGQRGACEASRSSSKHADYSACAVPSKLQSECSEVAKVCSEDRDNPVLELSSGTTGLSL